MAHQLAEIPLLDGLGCEVVVHMAFLEVVAECAVGVGIPLGVAVSEIGLSGKHYGDAAFFK